MTIDTSDWGSLSLNEHESEHYEKLGIEIQQQLDLAEDAAFISLHGLTSSEHYPRLDDPKGLAFLFMIKTAKSIRFAVIGLRLGYYTGASSVMRSALEALSFAYLFDSEPQQVAVWLRNELSGRDHEEIEGLRSKQIRNAKKSLLDQECKRQIVKDAMVTFCQEANKYTHTTILGLAKEFGVDIGYLLPDELAEAEGDPDMALERFVFTSQFGKNILQKRVDGTSPDDEIVEIEIIGRYDEEALSDLSSFIFYIGHRLLDMTKDAFAIKNKEFHNYYRDWHETINRL